MNPRILANMLAELYKRENMYANPIQTRPDPKAGVTGEEPDDEDLGTKYDPTLKDEEEVKQDIGKGSEKDIGKGTKKNIGLNKKSNPKNWKFKGPKDAVDETS